MAQRLADWMGGASAPLTHEDAWARHPAVHQQFDPALNHGLELTQIPLGADVGVVWSCTAGHTWTGSPRTMTASAPWKNRLRYACPKCVDGPVERQVDISFGCGHRVTGAGVDDGETDGLCPFCTAVAASDLTREQLLGLVVAAGRERLAAETDLTGVHVWQCAAGHHTSVRSTKEILAGDRCALCPA